jgi:hypothetical protein
MWRRYVGSSEQQRDGINPDWIAQMITTRQLNTRIIVRRIALGAKPFAWEIQGPEDHAPRSVSLDQFDNMEAAYTAGQAWLRQSLPAKPAARDRLRCNSILPANTQANDLKQDNGPLDDIDLDQFHASLCAASAQA